MFSYYFLLLVFSEMADFFINCWYRSLFLFKKWWRSNVILIKPRLIIWLYSSNYAFLSFFIISNSIFSVLSIFRATYYNYFWIACYNVVMLFNYKWRALHWQFIVKESLHIKVINKFIKVKNFGPYWICQSIDHNWSIRTSRCVWKS